MEISKITIFYEAQEPKKISYICFLISDTYLHLYLFSREQPQMLTEIMTKQEADTIMIF